MKNEEKNYISLSEAAKKTSYSGAYLNVLIKRGRLKAKKIGRNWYTSQDWIDEYSSSIQKAESNSEENKPTQEKNIEKEETKEKIKKEENESITKEIENLKAKIEEMKAEKIKFEEELENFLLKLMEGNQKEFQKINKEIKECVDSLEELKQFIDEYYGDQSIKL